MEQSKEGFLTQIVKTWSPNMEPEFRGFRCAACQEYITKSWHHELNSSEYLVPVHLCGKCQEGSGVEGGEWKAFLCDQCGAEIVEAYHIWNKVGSRLIETHLCASCGDKNV